MVWGHGSYMVSVLDPQALLSPAEVETSWQMHTMLKGELFTCQFVYSARIKLEFLSGKWDHASSLPCCIHPWEMLTVFLWFLIISCTLLWLSTRPWNLTLILNSPLRSLTEVPSGEARSLKQVVRGKEWATLLGFVWKCWAETSHNAS